MEATLLSKNIKFSKLVMNRMRKKIIRRYFTIVIFTPLTWFFLFSTSFKWMGFFIEKIIVKINMKRLGRNMKIVWLIIWFLKKILYSFMNMYSIPTTAGWGKLYHLIKSSNILIFHKPVERYKRILKKLTNSNIVMIPIKRLFLLLNEDIIDRFFPINIFLGKIYVLLIYIYFDWIVSMS